MLARSAVHLFFLGISFVCVLAIASDAAAYQIRVSTNSAAPGPDGNVSDDDVTTVVGPTIQVQIANTIDYTASGESTQYDTIGRAIASPSQLGVEARLDLVDYDTSQAGTDFETGARVFYSDVVTLTALEMLYLTPVYHLAGTISVSGGMEASLGLSMNFFSNTAGPVFTELARFQAPADGSFLDIDQQAMAPAAFAVTPGDFIEVRPQLNAQVMADTQALAAGDHGGTVDFAQTATLLGFALFADEAMTIPVLDGVAIDSEAGFSYDIVSGVPEPSTLALMLAAAGATVARRRMLDPGR